MPAASQRECAVHAPGGVTNRIDNDGEEMTSCRRCGEPCHCYEKPDHPCSHPSAGEKFKMLELENATLRKEIEKMKADYVAEEAVVSSLREDLRWRDLQNDSLALAWSEVKAARATNVPSGEFREDDERGERVRMAEQNLSAILDRIEKQKTEKRKGEWVIEAAPINCPGCGMTYVPSSGCPKCGWKNRKDGIGKHERPNQW